MKYLLCFAALLFTYTISEAQYTVIFKLDTYPLHHAKDSIFIAGSFNGWNPHSSAYALSPAGESSLLLYVKLPAGDYEYKCTRGSWAKTESEANGADIDNHDFTVNSDTSIDINIEGWKDDFAAVVRRHTASKQVHVMDSAFFIPQLNRNRRIWIYLPEGYTKTKKHYPVLYMQDGQNLFDAFTSSYGEWGVDECLDSLTRQGKQACIVVGIDNGPQRMNEYNPYEFQNFGKGEGEAYLEFLTGTLKPFIDNKYRTLRDKEHTMIAGSSMGGLIAYFAMLKQPDVFGKAGIFSPAFWTAPAIVNLTDSLASNSNGKFFFYIGQKEGASFVKDMEQVQDLLGERSSAMIYSVIDPQGKHHEKAWRKWFAEFYNWMITDGFNANMKVED